MIHLQLNFLPKAKAGYPKEHLSACVDLKSAADLYGFRRTVFLVLGAAMYYHYTFAVALGVLVSGNIRNITFIG